MDTVHKEHFRVERRQAADGVIMTRGEYNEHRGWELPSDENGDDEGVMLINGKHTSWIPKDIFEKECTKMENSIKITRPLNANCSIGNGQGAKELMPDFITWGDSDTFKLISKFSSENAGVMKSTKAMDCDGTVLLQVTTQQRNPDGSFSVAEALTTVPNSYIKDVWNEDKTEVTSRIILSNKQGTN